MTSPMTSSLSHHVSIHITSDDLPYKDFGIIEAVETYREDKLWHGFEYRFNPDEDPHCLAYISLWNKDEAKAHDIAIPYCPLPRARWTLMETPAPNVKRFYCRYRFGERPTCCIDITTLDI